MTALYLTEDDVCELTDMETTIDVVEDAFRHLADGTANNVPRHRATAPGIILHSMSAAAEYLGLVGWKNYTTCRHGARFHVAIYDAETGEMAALIEADYLGQMRTGAASGVATSYMARPDASTVGLFGTGKQARTQLKAVCSVRRIERVEVYGRNDDRRRAFAAEMTEYCATEVVPVHSPNEAAAEKDIIITATTGKAPVFDGKIFDEGTHLNVIGSNSLAKAEIDVTTVQRTDHIVCDAIDACRLEAGDFVKPLEEGVTDWQLMHDMCEVVAGRKTGRAVPEDVTLFKSVGLAIEDVALAASILERAKEAGLGSALPF